MVFSWLSSYKLKQLYFFTVLIVLAFASLLIFGNYFYSDSINRYAIKTTQEVLGARKIAPEYEKKIIEIANKLNAPIPLIRKMNHIALQTFGYHNAFAYFPCLFMTIPLSNQAFFYVSEGFFEDLSSEEQEFLIGHELIHIKEQHARYLNLVLLIFSFCLIMITFIIRKFLKRSMHLWFQEKYQMIFFRCISIFLFVVCIPIPQLINFAYRKHIERVADINSLQVLNSYEGFTKIMDRWKKEFNMPEHNAWAGLFSDHPSLQERKQYCLELQKQHDGDTNEL